MLPLTKKELKSHHQQDYTFVEKDYQNCLLKKKLIQKLETIVILQVNTEVQHIVFVT